MLGIHRPLRPWELPKVLPAPGGGTYQGEPDEDDLESDDEVY